MSLLKDFKATSDYDGGEWYDFKSWSHEDAATDYADSADSNSGGEFADGTVVTVKDEAGEERKFQISVGYEKIYIAHPYTPDPVAGTAVVNDGRPV